MLLVVGVARGLNEGEQVVLTPPLKAGAAQPGSKLTGIGGADANDIMNRIGEQLKAVKEVVPVTMRVQGPQGER